MPPKILKTKKQFADENDKLLKELAELKKQIKEDKKQIDDDKIVVKGKKPSSKAKSKAKPSKYNVTYNGIKYKGDTKKELMTKLNVSSSVLNKLLGDEDELFVYDKSKQSIKILDANKKFKPLLKKQFGVDNLKLTNTKQIINNKQVNVKFEYPKQTKNASYLLIHYTTYVEFSEEDDKDDIGAAVSKWLNGKNYDKVQKKTTRYTGPNNIEAIKKYVHDEAVLYWEDQPTLSIETVVNEIVTHRSAEKKHNTMKLKESEALCLFNENINHVKSDDNNCVKDFLMSIHGKRNKKNINNLEDGGITPDEILEYCNNKKIPCMLYNFDNQYICGNKIKTCKDYKGVYAMVYNNHIYPFKNKNVMNINKKEDIEKKVVVVKDENHVKYNLLMTIEKGELPYNIKMTHDKITSFECVECVYTCNQEYEECKQLCSKFGIKHIHHSTTFTTVHKLITPLYTFHEGKNINASSCFPNAHLFTTAGYLYSVDEVDTDKEISTIDKNKCFSYILKELDYLISVDYKNCEHKTEDFYLVDHYLYIIEVDESTVLLPENNIYTGAHVKFCEEQNVKFKIKEQISTTKHFNYFTKMIEDVYKLCKPKQAKDIINKLIGSFQQKQYNEFISFKHKIGTQEEVLCSEGTTTELNDEYSIITSNENKSSLNKCYKPIGFAIIEASYRLMYKKMQSLQLNTSDVVQVKTDSISFYDIKKNLDFGISDDFNDWKHETFKKVNSKDKENNYELSFLTNMNVAEQTTVLRCGDAGNGKTWNILNELLPSLNDDYIILTPTNACLVDYRKEKKICHVVQKFLFSGAIPEQKNIIIDECGMLDASMWNFIIKCIISGKNIYSYGDFTQLLPVGCEKQFDSNILMSAIFKEQNELKGNRRNKFTKKFYDKLRHGDNKFSKDSVYKYSSNWETAEYIICYRNQTVKDYNIKKMEHLNMNFGDVGCKLLLKKTDKNKGKWDKFSKDHEIYNNFHFVVHEKTAEGIIIKNSSGDLYNITGDELKTFFLPGYALTLYCVQGQSIDSYHYPEEDDFFLTNRSCYTLISRLKK